MSPVPVDRIGTLWPWIKVGLEEIIADLNVDWTVGDVYIALTSGTAYLFVAGQEDGFMIVQRQIHKFGPVLFVWVLHGDVADNQEAYFKFTDDLARAIGADRIRMHSPRKGWQRKGFKVKTMVYEREVPNG